MIQGHCGSPNIGFCAREKFFCIPLDEEREFCGNGEDKKLIGNAATLRKKGVLILDKVVHLNLTNLIEVVTRLCELGLRNCISPHAVETENTKLAL